MRRAEADAMTSLDVDGALFFATSLFQTLLLCIHTRYVFVCVSPCSTASGPSLPQSFNSNCRLFVWVRPYKHTIRLALCTEDYSWRWP